MLVSLVATRPGCQYAEAPAEARINRRTFSRQLAQSALGGLSLPLLGSGTRAPAAVLADAARPQITSGVASGDVTSGSAVLWSRCDRPAQMFVEIATSDSFRQSRTIRGPAALESSDFTAKLRLTGLTAGEQLFYRIQFQDLADPTVFSESVIGRFRSAPQDRRDVTFVWSGDTAGQGWGIDVARGGMRTYETMRRLEPDFFVHCGDTIYADNPIPSEIQLDDGSVWKNLVTEETAKVAETLDEFRGRFRYNVLDENVRRFQAEVPLLAQWDDHETANNWYPGEQLHDDRYTVKSASLLAARVRRAFFEYLPIRSRGDAEERIYRSVPYGPLLEVFFLDVRSYRGPNTGNSQPEAGAETTFLGREQMQWLKQRLRASRATWKVMCPGMPLGLIVRDGPDAFENAANGDGPPLGRELEMAELLRFIRDANIRNVVWLAADVHYAASHYYDPNRARFQEFEPFWEFVSGPLHAGTFGPNELDDTFGPQVRFSSVMAGMRGNRPPSEGLQFFGHVRIDGDTQVMSVSHYDVAGEKLWSVELEPHVR